MSDKYDSVLAEAASAIANSGFALEEFGSVQDIGWNGLVNVSETTLLNLGELELREEFLDSYESAEYAGMLVWIREDSQGFVSVVSWGHDGGISSGTDRVNQEWDAFVAENSEDQEELFNW